MKVLIFAGPGQDKEDLLAHFLKTSSTDERRKNEVKKIKNKILVVTCPSGTPDSLEEQIKDPKIASLLLEKKGARESKLMDSFHKLLEGESNEEGAGRKVLFGDYKTIYRWAKNGAVKDLLLSDKIFR